MLAWATPPLAKATALLALVIAVTAAAVLLVRSWAGRTGEDVVDASELLAKFRDLYARGGLSDAEYRTIKTKLAPDLQAASSANSTGASKPRNPRNDNPADPSIEFIPDA
ncbi:hypothetical protein Pla111_29180 [Botrimarina hoheduenensis]|uniref:SHOCT domain-containing protein n=2 Tax=Botrimarina hoheduenensis TaxID=2528000 RepID=A0A5C5VVA4_9BACT|nr:hypothetical protein Pla111_29180 [Botrimarina hoheduenensis]